MAHTHLIVALTDTETDWFFSEHEQDKCESDEALHRGEDKDDTPHFVVLVSLDIISVGEKCAHDEHDEEARADGSVVEHCDFSCKFLGQTLGNHLAKHDVLDACGHADEEAASSERCSVTNHTDKSTNNCEDLRSNERRPSTSCDQLTAEEATNG